MITSSSSSNLILMNFIIFNGRQVSVQEPVLHASNRAFRYGDGLFETIRVANGKIPLGDLHFKRLFKGMNQLKISIGDLTQESLTQQILQLCRKNDCLLKARVRMQVFRSGEEQPGFIIEATELPAKSIDWDDKGFIVDVFQGAAKSTDALSNLKSSNFLPYVMADIFAKENGLEDAIVLNVNGRIADTTRANIFLLKNNQLYTPPLSEGCVEGVMRSWMLENLTREVIQAPLSLNDMSESSEVFLTNAVFGIRWVRSFRNKTYISTYSKKVYSELISTIFH